MKTILITGSNGFIGSSLIRYLHTSFKYNVFGISKGLNRVSNLSEFHYFDCDITQGEKVKNVFDRVKPDIVIHCAAISQVDVCESDPDLCHEVNVAATEFITVQCKKNNARMIFLSSDFVFDGTLPFVGDNTIPNPISVYGQSKRVSEIFVESNLLDWAIVRPVLVYGYSSASSRANIFSWVYNSLKDEKSITVVSDQMRTPTFINDVVLLVDCLIRSTSSGYFNIGGSKPVTVYKFAKEIARLSGMPSSLVVEGSSIDVNGAQLRPVNSCFRNQRIQSEFSITPLSLTMGIKRSLLQIKV